MACGTKRWRAYSVVLGGVLIHLTLGTIYTFGNMTPYMTSYMRKHGVSSSLDYADSTWINSLAAMGQGLSMFLGGILYRKLGPKRSTLIGCWMASLGVFLTYFTIKTSFILTVLSYGFLFGIGVGIAYATPMGCAMKWLPDNEGLVNGCVVAGFGGGAFIFDQVQTAFLNPNNEKADHEVDGEKYFIQDSLLDKVPSCFLMLGGCYAAMQFIGSMLLADPPNEYKLLPTIAPEEEQSSACAHDTEDAGAEETSQRQIRGIDSALYTELDPSARHSDSYSPDEHEKEIDRTHDMYKDNEVLPCPGSRDLTPRQVLRNPSFYKLWFIYLFYGQGILFISQLYKAYGQTFITDDFFLSVVGSLAAVCNGSGRIMWGRIADKTSFKTAMVFSSGLFTFFILTFQLTSLVGKGLYLPWVCLLFLCFSGNFSLLPTATAKSFGISYYGINYGMVFTASVISSPISALLSSTLKGLINWYGMFYLVAFFSMISLSLAWSYNIKDDNNRDI